MAKSGSSSAFVAVRRETGMKEFGFFPTVHDDPKCKLMYYLHSVASVIDIDDPNIRRLKDYKNYATLSEEDTMALLLIVLVLSPDELLNKVFFQSDELCGNYENQFYEVSQVSHTLAIAGSVLIDGKSKRVNKIMVFRMSWLQENYLDPVKALHSKIQAAKAQEARLKSRCALM